MSPIEVLIVDAAEPIRHGLKAILKSAPDINVIGEATDGATAIEQAEKLRPDVMLIDAVIAESGQCECCAHIRKIAPDTKLLFLLTYVAQQDTGLTARADGYWLKDGGRAELIQAIRSLVTSEHVA